MSMVTRHCQIALQTPACAESVIDSAASRHRASAARDWGERRAFRICGPHGKPRPHLFWRRHLRSSVCSAGHRMAAGTNSPIECTSSRAIVSSLPALRRRGQLFDAFHVDGAKKNYLGDVLHCRQMMTGEEAVVIIDDTNGPLVAATWRRCLRWRIVAPLDAYPSQDEGGFSNEIAQLLPPCRLTLEVQLVAGGSHSSRVVDEPICSEDSPVGSWFECKEATTVARDLNRVVVRLG